MKTPVTTIVLLTSLATPVTTLSAYLPHKSAWTTSSGGTYSHPTTVNVRLSPPIDPGSAIQLCITTTSAEHDLLSYDGVRKSDLYLSSAINDAESDTYYASSVSGNRVCWSMTLRNRSTGFTYAIATGYYDIGTSYPRGPAGQPFVPKTITNSTPALSSKPYTSRYDVYTELTINGIANPIPSVSRDVTGYYLAPRWLTLTAPPSARLECTTGKPCATTIRLTGDGNVSNNVENVFAYWSNPENTTVLVNGVAYTSPIRTATDDDGRVSVPIAVSISRTRPGTIEIPLRFDVTYR